jgi:hypothetical protein
MIFGFVCCGLSGRGLCDELITRPKVSYRLWRVVVCDQETVVLRNHSPRWTAEPEKLMMMMMMMMMIIMVIIIVIMLLLANT